MYKIGCDQHKRYAVMHILNQKGKFVNQVKLNHNDPEGLNRFFSDLPEDSHMAIEACSYDAWLCDLAESHGVHIHLAHPLKTKAIAQARIKTDTIDAKILAQLLHGDLLAEAYYAPAPLRDKRYLLRYRQCLVKYRTSLKNRIHHMLDGRGIITPQYSDLFGKKGQNWLKTLELPPTYRQCLDGYLDLFANLSERIKDAEASIRQILEVNPQSELLQSIPGVGQLTAFLLLAEIGPINRFSCPEKLCSYAGLVPSLHQSGQSYYTGSITKTGNKFIRWAIVEASHRAILADPGLNKFYERIRYKKGSNKAVVAVARKLLTYVYHVLNKQEPYRFQNVLPQKPAVRCVL